MQYPDTLDKIIRHDPVADEITKAFMAPEPDGSFTAFFAYEGPDDRFIYGVKKGLTEEQATAYIEKEEKRLNHA